jgi:tetratricopeptide (TPR) repeat protein
MTTDTSTKKAPLAGKRRAGRYVLCGAVLLGLAAAAAFGLNWWLPTATPPDPPLPTIVEDPEVGLAIQRARDEVLKNPRSADAWGEMGKTLWGNVFDLEADRCFAEAVRLAPDNAQWIYARAHIAANRDPERAVPLFRQAVAHSISWPDGAQGMRLKLAETLQSHQEIDEAEGMFQDELRRTPGDARATFGLGLIALTRGNDRAAEEYLSAVTTDRCARKKATAQLAALAAVRGDATAAADWEKQCRALPDDSPWPDPFLEQLIPYKVGRRYWERTVSELEKDHRYKEAAEVFLRQIDENPTPLAYTGAGANLAGMEDYDRALPFLQEALRLDPNFAHAHHALGFALFNRASKALQQSPQSPQAKLWLADAVDHERRATELKPDHSWAYLCWGMSLRQLGEPTKAIEVFQQGLACHPELFEMQIAMAETYLDLGQFAEAEPYLENARRLEPQDPRLVKDFERLRNKKN